MMGDPKDAMGASSHKRRKRKLSDAEISQLVEGLAASDLKSRRRAGMAISAQGKRAIEPLLQALDHRSMEVRRSAAFLLGKVGSRAGQAIQNLLLDRLVAALRDQDPKVRKNSAISLGRLGKRNAVPHLMQAVDDEAVDWVRPSLLLALGAISGDAARGYLASYRCRNEDEHRAFRKALDHVSRRREKPALLSSFRPPIEVLLHTPPGVEDVLRRDVADKMAEHADVEVPGTVRTRVSNTTNLLQVRSFSEMLLPVGCAAPPSLDDVPEAVLELLKATSAFDTVVSLHEIRHGALRYRLEIRGAHIKHYQRQRMAQELSERIDGECDLLLNSTSDYDVELRAVVGNDGQVRVYWVPYSYHDPRFEYRVSDVPASISPVVAAGLVGLLQPKRDRAVRVLDPFCGSGTLLVERERRGPCEQLVGIDISGQAVEAARENIKAAQSDRIRLICGDMRTARQEGVFDEVITNMPFGLRAGSHKENQTLYADFVDLLPGFLGAGGQFVLFTHEVSLLQRLLGGNKLLAVASQLRIETGGLKPAAFIGHRL